MSTPNEDLRERYGRLNDSALLDLSSDPDALSDVAKQVLRAELDARGLTASSADDDEGDEPEERRLVTVGAYRDLSEAIVMRSVLDAAGIETYLQNENMIRLDWPTSNALGGIKLQVADVDVEAATAAMQQPVTESTDVDEFAEFEQPRCPRCGSREVTFKGRSRGAALISLMVFSLPLPLGRAGWACDACGEKWGEESAEGGA